MTALSQEEILSNTKTVVQVRVVNIGGVMFCKGIN